MVAVFLGLVSGVILATIFEIHSVPIWSLAGLAVSVTLVLLGEQLEVKFTPGAVLAATMLFGVVVYGFNYFDPSLIQERAEEINHVEGQVITYPKMREDGIEFTMKPEEYEDKVKVFLSDSGKYSVDYGDRVTASGDFQRPGKFQGFNYREYLRKKGTWLVIYRGKLESLKKAEANPIMELGWTIRQLLTSRIDRFLPKGNFLRAILFGNRAILGSKITNAFTGTGMAHLLATSGLHLGILIGVIWWILKVVGLTRRKIYLLTMPGLFLYLAAVGFRLPLVRASLIYVFGGAHFYLEDSGLILSEWYDRYQALATAALLLVLYNPESITMAGFQLSFGATFAIAVFIEPIEEALEFKPDYLSGILAASIAAQIGVAPVLAVHFGQVHPWAPLANLLAIPMVTLVLYFGLFLLPLGGIKFIGFVIAKVTGLAIFLTESLVLWLSSLPLASVQVSRTTPLALLSYFILLFWFFRKLKSSTTRTRYTNRYISR